MLFSYLEQHSDSDLRTSFFTTHLFHSPSAREEVRNAEKCDAGQLLSNKQETDSTNISTTVLDCIAERVQSDEKHIAVVYGQEKITYAELYRQSTVIASDLQRKGIVSGDLVGILMDTSLQVIPTILGILQAGAGYLPIDTHLPEERIDTILRTSRCGLVATDQKNQSRLPKKKVYRLPELSADVDFHAPPISAEDVCYVIYTSGSTGKPKGVVVQHGALMNLCRWHIRQFSLSPEDHTTRYAGFGFDAAVWEIFPSLVAGATIYMIPDNLRLDLEQLNQYFEENHITVSFLPTPVCEQFFRLSNHSLRILLTGGDKLNQFYGDHRYRVFNNYGPTENTVVTTSFEVKGTSENIPIGKPIDGVFAYVMDEQGRLCPPFARGELCIGGNSLAKGYLYDDEKTDEMFIESQFGRLYRTGDIVRWNTDGNLLFFGRKDHQVKINGNRIELGEIEHTIAEIDGVKGVAVIVDSRNGADHLVACYVAEEEIPNALLQEKVVNKLPYYMVPEQWMRLDAFPLTENGKIDRKTLRQLVSKKKKHTGAHLDTLSDTELHVLAIWQELLGREDIDCQDHFMDVGGNSILVVKMKQAIEEQYPDSVTISDIFGHPSITSLAAWIDRKRKHEGPYTLTSISLLHPALSQEREGILSINAGASLFSAMHSLFVEKPKFVMAIVLACYAIALSSLFNTKPLTMYVGHEGAVRKISLDPDDFTDLSALVAYVEKKFNEETSLIPPSLVNKPLDDDRRTVGFVFEERTHSIVKPFLDFGVSLSWQAHDFQLSLQYRKMGKSDCQAFLSRYMDFLQAVFRPEIEEEKCKTHEDHPKA